MGKLAIVRISKKDNPSRKKPPNFKPWLFPRANPPTENLEMKFMDPWHSFKNYNTMEKPSHKISFTLRHSFLQHSYSEQLTYHYLFCSWSNPKREPPEMYWVTMANCWNTKHNWFCRGSSRSIRCFTFLTPHTKSAWIFSPIKYYITA